MAVETYKQQQEEKYKEMVENLVKEMPSYIKDYKTYLGSSVTNNTKLNYLRDIKSFFKYITDCYNDNGENINSIKEISLDILSSISATFINEYFEYIELYNKSRTIISKKGTKIIKEKCKNEAVSKQRKLSSLRSLYNYLYEYDKISINPIVKVRQPKPETKKIIRLDNEESQEYIKNVESGKGLSKTAQTHHKKLKDRDLAINMILLSTGIRVSECVGLNIDDVDLKHNSLRVYRKGNKEDIVYFSDEAKEIIDIYIEKRKKMETLEGHENALFISNQKRRITVRSVEKLVKKYAEVTTPLKKITPHKLRSTFGTNLYNATNDIYLVSSRLGHSSIEVAKKYVEAEETKKRDSRNLVEYRDAK